MVVPLTNTLFTQKQEGRIDTEASYPYKGVKGTCDFNSSAVGAQIITHRDPGGITHDESELTDAISQAGMRSICVCM